jgi:hypothetical protein
MSGWIKLALIAAALALLAGAAWKVHDSIWQAGYQAREAELQIDVAAAKAAAGEIERMNRASKERAIDQRTKEILANVAAAERARNVSERLLDSSQRSLRAASADHSACIVSAAAHAQLLDYCQRAYRDMAKNADAHATDLKTLIEAWPRQTPQP